MLQIKNYKAHRKEVYQFSQEPNMFQIKICIQDFYQTLGMQICQTFNGIFVKQIISKTDILLIQIDTETGFITKKGQITNIELNKINRRRGYTHLHIETMKQLSLPKDYLIISCYRWFSDLI